MEEHSARAERDTAVPVFAAYRRGYDPDQVDRYVAEQSLRTEAANERADEAERKLASAVQRLRDMQRRVEALESMEPPSQLTQPIESIAVDTLGVHVQRILTEAWEGSHALRQEAEQDAARLREEALAEGDRIVASARRKATSISEEMARRRQVYLEKLESERSRAVSQMGFLQEQRKLAIDELNRVKTLVDTTIAEVTIDSRPTMPSESEPVAAPPMVTPKMAPTPTRTEGTLAPTLQVHRLAATERHDPPDPSELVRSHRAAREIPEETGGVVHRLPARDASPSAVGAIFDFDEQERDDH